LIFKSEIPDECVIEDESDPDLVYEWAIHEVDIIGLRNRPLQLPMPEYDGQYMVLDPSEPGVEPFFYMMYAYVESPDDDAKSHTLVAHALVTDGESYSSVFDPYESHEGGRSNLLVEKECHPVPPKKMILEALGAAGG